jgi:hypothetical protein
MLARLGYPTLRNPTRAVTSGGWYQLSRGAGQLPADDLLQLRPWLADLCDGLVRDAVAANLRLGVQGIRAWRPPTPEELDRLAQTAAERALQDVPLEQVLWAYRIGFAEAWQEARSLSVRLGLEVDDALQLASIFMAWTSGVMDAVTAAHMRVGLRLAHEDQQRRARFLRALLSGALPDEELRRSVAAYSLDPAARYLPVRVRATGEQPPHGLAHRVQLALHGLSM